MRPTSEPHAHAVGLGAEGLERARDELVDRPELRLRLRCARLEAREVEQVRDQALEACSLEPNRLEQRRAVLFVQVEGRALEAAGCGPDRRQRRAQVVA